MWNLIQSTKMEKFFSSDPNISYEVSNRLTSIFLSNRILLFYVSQILASRLLLLCLWRLRQPFCKYAMIFFRTLRCYSKLNSTRIIQSIIQVTQNPIPKSSFYLASFRNIILLKCLTGFHKFSPVTSQSTKPYTAEQFKTLCGLNLLSHSML